MKKIISLFFCMVLMLFLVPIVSASDVTKEDLDKVNLSYYWDYGEANSVVLAVHNIPEGVRVMIKTDEGVELANNDEYPGEEFFFLLEDLVEKGVNVNVVLDCNCETTSPKTINFNKPKYNSYSQLEVCEDNTDLKLCDAFEDTSEIKTEEEFVKKVNKESKKNNIKNDVKDVTEKSKLNWLYFAVPFAIATVIVAVIIIVTKKGTKKDEE